MLVTMPRYKINKMVLGSHGQVLGFSPDPPRNQSLYCFNEIKQLLWINS